MFLALHHLQYPILFPVTMQQPLRVRDDSRLLWARCLQCCIGACGCVRVNKLLLAISQMALTFISSRHWKLMWRRHTCTYVCSYKQAQQWPPNGSINPQSDTRTILMCVDRSRGTWQISGEVFDCLSHQINQEWITVTEPFYRSLLLYFMLSLLFSLAQDTNLFHQWFSCWPCRLVYLRPPLSFSSYEVIASWGETWKNNTRSDRHRECNWQKKKSTKKSFIPEMQLTNCF